MNKNLKGLQFPENTPGNRSTLEMCLRLIHHISPSYSLTDSAPFVSENRPHFRKTYTKFFKRITIESINDPKTALSMARKGLEFVHNEFQFIQPEGSSIPFKEEMSSTKRKFTTKIVQNKKDWEESEYTVKYKGKEFFGKSLCKLVDQWTAKGVMEQDTSIALRSIALSNRPYPNSLPLKEIKDHVFILIGAGSAMCPFNTLAELGATIIAIDISIESIWKRLEKKIANCRGAKMYYPICMENGVEVGGCDLLQQPAEIFNWLKDLSVVKNAKHLTIGNYTYLDGAKHVLLSVAADSIISKLSSELRNDLNVAFLCTPTDLSIIPEEAYYASIERYKSYHFGSLFEWMVQFLSLGKQLKKNDITTVGKAKPYCLYNGLAVAQGPNYALAKTIQQWRAIVQYNDFPGGRISLNVAPATATLSVIHVKKFMWVFNGMAYFSPMEIFMPETSSSVMAGLMIKDILSQDKNNTKNENPLELKSQQAFHGGAWRCAYSQNTIGMASVIVHFLGGPKFFNGVVLLLFFFPFFLFLLGRK